MSNTSSLPPERLNKIAATKLATLSVSVQLDPQQRALVGELTFSPGKLLHPGTRAPLSRAKFAVVGHDHLQFLGPPLADLGPILFYDAPTFGALEGRIAAALQRATAPGAQVQAAPTAVAAPAQAVLEAVPPAANSVTLALLAAKLGSEAVFGLGRPGEVAQNFAVGKLVYRFSAAQVAGTTFSGTLTSSTGEKKWSDKFDLLRFPGITQVVASVLGVQLHAPAPAPASAAPAPAQEAAASAVPSHLVPQVGEVWVMNVLIEREDQDEVRYACTNIDGKPFGATRLLKSSEFREVFVQAGTGWRLLIQVEEVGADLTVSYRQLDSRRQPRGGQKRIPGSILVTNFVPEATAY